MKIYTSLIEEGDPCADGRIFRRCLGQFATGVTVMTARDGEATAGMTVNSFSALSLDPPLVLWSIRRESKSLPVFQAARHFAVNVLADDQVELSALFASPSTEKIGQVDWLESKYGTPLLKGAIAHLECELEQSVDGGDHLIMIGRVKRYARFTGDPLLFTQGRYAVAQDHPAAIAAPAATVVCPNSDDLARGSLLRLLHYSSRQISSWFETHREEEGISMAQSRIYGWLLYGPHSIESLASVSFLGNRVVADNVAALVEAGHIERDESGLLHLTQAGRETATIIARRAQRFELDLLKNVDPGEVASARRVLAKLCTAQ